MKDTRPVLLGMANPQGNAPLHPHPPGCAGWRLWHMLHERTGATPEQYEAAFDRRNLVEGKEWRPGVAKVRAADLIQQLRNREVVVLGSAARIIVGLPEMLIHPLMWKGITWRQLPHPSGRNLWYNNRTHRTLAAVLLEDLYNSVHQH